MTSYIQLLDSSNNKLFNNKGQPSFTPQSTYDQTVSQSIALGVPISSYSLSFANNATPDSSKFNPGKISFSGLDLTRNFDQWSPFIFNRLASGTTFKTLILVNFSNTGAGGGNRIMSVLTFSNVLLVNQNLMSGGDGVATESLQFMYGKVQMGYQPVDASGKAGNPVQADWDLFVNKGSVS
ncbi:uncharacterized protein RHO25_003945 [Cercospora beticola]|uniref:Type VI secretion system tube protein Hcp n=1 Tax=Cercospora beticola TaxID=122368 RepID=A0ABZ0NIJ9_CERBT|nr:hypothetical protein RHO25_003945 [Cercospora beticola]